MHYGKSNSNVRELSIIMVGGGEVEIVHGGKTFHDPPSNM